jgi:hypothetical protein
VTLLHSRESKRPRCRSQKRQVFLQNLRDANSIRLENRATRTPRPCSSSVVHTKIWPEIGRKYHPIYRFPANIPVANHLKTKLRLPFRLHGMEEVVGSIPTRSTNSLNKLDGASARNRGVCVMVCVITRRLGAHSKGFHRSTLRFHPHVAVPLQHATADVSGNRHDR